jgi:hypothetical protein
VAVSIVDSEVVKGQDALAAGNRSRAGLPAGCGHGYIARRRGARPVAHSEVHRHLQPVFSGTVLVIVVVVPSSVAVVNCSRLVAK